MQTIGKNILDNIVFLKKLSATKSVNKQKRLLHLATNQELFTIIEIAYNILKDRFQLSNRQKARLLPHAHLIRKIGRARTSKGLKKIVQSGGAFPVISSLIAPIIIEAISLLAQNGE